MSIRASYISWLLVVILLAVIGYQYIGANKAEQRAAQAEAQAKDVDAKLQQFMAQSEARQKQAEAQYQASLAESVQLRAILAKGSQRPITAPSQTSSTLPPLTANEAAKSPPNAAGGQSSCSPFIYQDKPLVIEEFQVQVCDGQPMVRAESALALRDSKALVDKLTTQVAEATAKLALEDKDLVAYKVAEAQWKKAAKKSRIKRVLGVAEKVGLFAAGVYAGRKF